MALLQLLRLSDLIQNLTEFVGWLELLKAPGCSLALPEGWSGISSRKLSSKVLKDSFDPVQSRMHLGRTLKSFGPSEIKDFSFKVLMDSSLPDLQFGMADSLPFPEKGDPDIPQLGICPCSIFQI